MTLTWVPAWTKLFVQQVRISGMFCHPAGLDVHASGPQVISLLKHPNIILSYKQKKINKLCGLSRDFRTICNNIVERM